MNTKVTIHTFKPDSNRTIFINVIQNKINSSQILFKKKNNKVLFEEQGPVYAWADELMIEEVFCNYLSNALNHVYENGTIRFRFLRILSFELYQLYKT